MRRVLIAIVVASAAAFGQSIVNPARLPATIKTFEPQPGERSVRCEVIPLKPVLNFGFRFQAGYVVHVPLKQYEGSGHRLVLLTRITPQGATHKPVYLMNVVRLPAVPKTKVSLELVGNYLLGEGSYRVEWVLLDETKRVCRKHWRADARLNYAERKVIIAMPPDTVTDLSLRGSRGVRRNKDDARPVRLTVLLHAAPLSPRRTKMRASDKMMLLGTLSTMLDRVPTRSLRLVVFNLDQQKELFRRDDFTPDALEQLTQSLNALELGSVDYNVLLNRRGHVDLLADLVNQELAAKEPSDEVVVLGPPSRFFDKLPPEALEKPPHAGARFFYLQLNPYFRGAGTSFPDSINSAVARLKGKTVVIHTPGEFAKAIDQIESAAAGK
jgi:hypothetical protein